MTPPALLTTKLCSLTLILLCLVVVSTLMHFSLGFLIFLKDNYVIYPSSLLRNSEFNWHTGNYSISFVDFSLNGTRIEVITTQVY